MFGRLLVCVVMVNAGAGDDPAASVPGRTPDRTAYEAARKAAGQDAAANVRLALWCEQHGMTAERMKHLATAVLYDPSNGLARGLMGLVARGGQMGAARGGQPRGPRRPPAEGPDGGISPAPGQGPRQGRRPVAAGPVVRRERAEGAGRRALPRGVAAGPERDAVWKHLGFKKVNGGWIKPEWQEAAKREAGEQARANKRWKPLLEKWGAGLSSRVKARREEAEAGLAGVTDPRAVPMIWAVFVARGAEGQRVALRVLRRIDAPGSTRAIALMALRSPVADVRRDAIAILRDRDPRDYGGLLVTLAAGPHPVRGPPRQRAGVAGRAPDQGPGCQRRSPLLPAPVALHPDPGRRLAVVRRGGAAGAQSIPRFLQHEHPGPRQQRGGGPGGGRPAPTADADDLQ